MSGFQTPITVLEAMHNINNRKYLLPAFQREFVWDAPRIENLFDSLMRGYPINSMLFWEVDKGAFNCFTFYDFLTSYIQSYQTHNVAHNGFHGNFYAVLDGQQRLTSLYIGLYGSYAYHNKYMSWDNNTKNFPPRHLYLNISAINPNAGEGEKMYDFSFLKDSDTGSLSIYTDMVGQKWLKVAEIVNLKDSAAFASFVNSNNVSQEFAIIDQFRQVICVQPHINYYLEDSVSPDQAVNIFVRTNAGGRPLSLSDIMLSITIAGWNNVDARKEFQDLSDQISAKGFYINHDYILKAFLCLFHSSVKNRIQSFDSAFLQTIETNWNDVKEAIVCLFDLLQSFGLDNSTLKSYNATMPILCYLYWNRKYVNFATAISHATDRDVIRKWLLRTLLFRSFGASADAALQNAIRNLKGQSLFPATTISTNIGQPNVVDPAWVDSLLNVQKDDPYAFSILSLLYPNCNFAVTKFDKDHLHPAASFHQYQAAGGKKSWAEYNSIVNLQLLESSENKSKGDTPLVDWVTGQLVKRPNINSETYLPTGISLDLADFDIFYEERKKYLFNALSSAL